MDNCLNEGSRRAVTIILIVIFAIWLCCVICSLCRAGMCCMSWLPSRKQQIREHYIYHPLPDKKQEMEKTTITQMV